MSCNLRNLGQEKTFDVVCLLNICKRGVEAGPQLGELIN
jgi:hypothetical protein